VLFGVAEVAGGLVVVFVVGEFGGALAVAVLSPDVGPRADEHLDDLQLALAGREVEGRAAVLIAGVQDRAVVQEVAHLALLALFGGLVEAGAAVLVAVPVVSAVVVVPPERVGGGHGGEGQAALVLGGLVAEGTEQSAAPAAAPELGEVEAGDRSDAQQGQAADE
jgi:hypothetical protein